MNVLDLFSGIGGFSLGLERAGMRTVAFCEIDPYCQRVLRKHWPDVPCHGDITTREFYEGEADIIAAGFPCQDISTAGAGAGLAGKRSGLWRELLRAICLVRPRHAIVENVAMLLGRGMGEILGDLAEIGNDTEWHCIPASAIGAPHVRDRIWIVTNPDGKAEHAGAVDAEMASLSSAIPDAAGGRLAQRQGLLTRRQITDAAATASRQWDDLPDVGRAVHGIPQRVHRIRALGNAIVPQIAEIIGRAIMSIEHDGYDGNDDFTRSIEEAYRVIRERKQNGGPGWGGWE
jgi:DNA (cytosine-5)-methyltransferase 1